MEKKTIPLGISMAGAISAGAYTAGVMDYLLEALENWQKAKDLQQEGKLSGIPKHEIVIDILSGASAGGMTAALTAAAIQTNFDHVSLADVENNAEKLAKNPLYHSWVDLTEENHRDMMSQMLSTEDIENDRQGNPDMEVRSVFNSSFIKTVAERHINSIIKDNAVYRPYFAGDMEVFATLTNLRGIPFEVAFGSSSYTRVHRMKRHFDIAHFRLGIESEYKKDGRIPLNFNDAEGLNKELLIQSAMATGGFPIGLEPRIIKRLGKYIKENKYLNLGNRPDLHTVNAIDEFLTLNVDGGTINNDPFELTQELLDERMGVLPGERKTKASDFESVVLMIDPFPNHSDLPDTNYLPLRAFKFIISQILSAMLGELRMKEEVLKSAYGDEDYTKFLIIPSRSGANPEIENYIACGSLGGFGGFFNKQFREHDFLLGRRNCQQFLRKHFSAPVDADNPILAYGYEGVEDRYKVSVNHRDYFPLLPDIRVKHDEITGKYSIIYVEDFEEVNFKFPEIKLSYLLGLQDDLEKRISSLVSNITNGEAPEREKNENDIVKRLRKKPWHQKLLNTTLYQPLTGLLLWFAKKKVKGIMARKFLDIVIADMDKNELLTDDKKLKK